MKAKYSKSLWYPAAVAVGLLLSSVWCKAAEISDPGIHIKSAKVLHLNGVIQEGPELDLLAMEARVTANLPGDRIVIIHSPGGVVEIGQRILDMLLREKAITGGKLICVVDGYAHSMAFNILSFCDERYATKGSRMIAHKVRRMMDPGEMYTEKQLSEIAKELHILDAKFRVKNAHELHMTLEEYDRIADDEKVWTVEELMARGYIQRIVTLK